MTDLTWTYQDLARLPEYRATYRGFTLRAVHDQSPENPFESWEGEPPTLVYQGRDGFTDYSDGATADPLDHISDSRLARRWKDVAKALDISAAEYQRERAERRAEYGDSAADTRRALAETVLDDARNGNGSDYLETLATLWRIAGCVAETWSSHGYSQGDWGEGLSVATPAWAKEVGAPRASHSAQCKAAGKLWGHWAWGNVYGYVIDGEEDSCWGFYGDDFAESGLEEAAKDAVDGIISARSRRRQQKAGELIRARVPLDLRPSLLDSVA